MSAVNLALSQNLAARPKKVVLPPPQVFVFELSAGGAPTRLADFEAMVASVRFRQETHIKKGGFHVKPPFLLTAKPRAISP